MTTNADDLIPILRDLGGPGRVYFLRAADLIESQARENARLRERLAEIREVWAGSEGLVNVWQAPCASNLVYWFNLAKKMYDLAVEALK
jgi:hypothetical protein